MTETTEPQDQAAVLDMVHALGTAVLTANYEDDFLLAGAKLLFEHVSCDAVAVLRAEEEAIRGSAVATKHGARRLAADEMIASFSAADRQLWQLMSETAFIPDMQTTSLIKPRFKEYARKFNIVTGLVVPLTEKGDILGFVAFGWHAPRSPERLDRARIRMLLDIFTHHLVFLHTRMRQHHDPLTGLYNRLALEQHWAGADAPERGVFLYMDLDGFKALNDARGHAAGDEYLREAARQLKEVVPAGGAVYRLGGDEFLLVAPGIAPGDVDRLADKISRRFETLARSLPPPRPGITIGAAYAPEDGTDLDELLELADQRMYERKRKRAMMTLVTTADTLFTPPSMDDGDLDADFDDGGQALSQGMFQGWLEMWPDGFFVTDPDFKIIFVNEAFERMTGYSREAWVGKSPAFIASGEVAPMVYRQMWDSLTESGAWTGQVVNRRPDGVEWVSLMSVASLMRDDGRVTGYMGNSRDVSHSLWAGRHDRERSFQEAFTQEALAFALAEAGQLHEGGSRQHLERIRDFTRLLVLGAADAGYQELQQYERRNTIILASILHDIGKLAIPEGLLRKPGRLTKEEFELMKTHTVAGEELLRSPYFAQDRAAPESEFLSVASCIARCHHEWWDGSGYPDGLRGEDIPLGARIVGIADVYDALRSQRPYKNPWSHRETVEYIVGGAGTQFDPKLVKIFIDKALEFKAVSERALDESRARTRPQQGKTG